MAHVLVVDDDAGIRGLVARMLERLQHSVETAENGAVALEMLATASFDLVVSDVCMPVMDGGVLLETLRAQGDPTPFLVMSGHLYDAGDQIAFLADGFLKKPFMLGDLTKQIHAVLNKALVA